MLLRRPHHAPLPIALSAFAALLLAGCPGTLDASFDSPDGGGGDPARAASPSCPDVPTAVLAAKCGGAGCHGAASPAAGLDLASSGVAARLAGKAASQGGLLVDPSSPTTSVLYTKLGAAPPFGSRMPLGAAPLDDATLACVASWIAGGAPSSTPQAPGGDGADGAAPASADGGGPALDASSPASGWTPAALAGAVIWLDASQGVTSAGAHVSAWTDRSPKHNDAAQDTDGNRPSLVAAAINGHPALKFEESRTTFLAIPDSDSLRWGTGGFAVAIVAANRKATVGRKHGGGVSTVFAKPQQGNGATEVTFHLNWFTGESTDDDGNIHVGVGEGNPGEQSSGGAYNDGKARVYVARVAPSAGGTDYELFVNGAAAGKLHANGSVDVTLTGSPVRIGSTYGQSVEGDVAEVVAVKGALADADLASLTTYLTAKYAIAP